MKIHLLVPSRSSMHIEFLILSLTGCELWAITLEVLSSART